MSVKFLCKIAILKTNPQTDNNSIEITHNNKIYCPIIDWDPNYLVDISKHRDFCLVALKFDDGIEYLTIFHDGTRLPGKRRSAREKILSICFPEFRTIAGIQAVEDGSLNEKQTIKIHDVTAKLYSLLRTAHSTENENSECDDNLDNRVKNIRGLEPILRNYQRRTVQWLLRREEEPSSLKHFYKYLKSEEGYKCYVNELSLDIIDEPPTDINIPLGGILAEEMGLGKTVEMLSLILLNRRVLNSMESNEEPPIKRRCKNKQSKINVICVCGSTKSKKPKISKNIEQCSDCSLYQHTECIRSYIDFPLSDEDGYICPKCWELRGIVLPSAATVIVSPSTIKLQWLSEINKHTNPPLRVLLYEGVGKQKISPRELAEYDVVLTDYATLRSEIYYIASNETHISFRKQRERMRVNSPLLLVEWWRVCLDEAQMETSKSQPAKLVKQLPAINRWAVTGTPIQSSLEDLYSLLDFIGFNEFLDPWKHLVAEFLRGRSENMVKILQKVMWRTSKIDVINELEIPPQQQRVHFVELSNVEKLFYADEHADCLSAFYDKIEGYSDLKGVTTKVLNTILQPMLKLRQDCSIPVLFLKSEKNVMKKFLQPQELLDHMKSSNELECKEKLRSMASIYNGMAALHFIQENYNEAIKYYERVMDLSKKYVDSISVDSLLQIHAIYNAIQAYRTIHSTDPPIIQEYEVQYNKLEWKYLQPYAANLQAAHKGYTSALNALSTYKEKKPKGPSSTWDVILLQFKDKKLDEHLMEKINDEVSLLHGNSLYERFRMIRSVLLVLDIWYKKIHKIRKQLSDQFNTFEFFIENVRPRNDVPVTQWRKMNKLIRSVYNCHLNQEDKSTKSKLDGTNKKKTLCELCETEKLLQTYECLIFDKSIDEKTSNAEGTWNPTMQETIVKTICAAVRAKNLRQFVKDCELEFEIIALMKTEYKALVKLWIEIEYTVKAYDEMEMCKMRTQLAREDEERKHFNVYAGEIDELLAESKLNFDQEQKEFVLRYARLKYIRHLEGGADPDPCPICRADNQMKYVVLECGHHLCFFCLKTISQLNKTARLSCSICRNEQRFENVYYVTRKTVNKDGIDIKGDFSSKIHKIVLEVLRLKLENKDVKIIIFSHWLPVLKALSEALNENNITIKINKSPKCVEQFKDEALGITCLLMELRTKAQGLNLIEATHVFLVEPILNPGEELQAIGRIHRIGQTKATFVHRFIVKNTIEENIYNTVVKDKTNDSSDLTIESIKKLFELHSYD